MSELESQPFRVHHAHHLHRLVGRHTLVGRMRINCWIMGMLTGTLTVLACSSPLQEYPADVIVEGGMDPTNRHYYSWTIANGNDEPIVAVEIPHYRGLIFTVPRGWSKEVTEWETGSAEVDVGRLRATAPTGGGIRRGQSATFSIQLHARGASAQRGDMIVEFADGASATIVDIEYPGKEPWLTRNMTLVGMIGLVVVALVVHLLRRGRAKRTPPSET